MTISYTSDVANASRFGVFTSILIRWKGSVYKLVYKELLAFLAGYFALNIFYRTVLKSPEGNEQIKSFRNWFEGKADLLTGNVENWLTITLFLGQSDLGATAP